LTNSSQDSEQAITVKDTLALASPPDIGPLLARFRPFVASLAA
jgi:hypothetical protein